MRLVLSPRHITKIAVKSCDQFFDLFGSIIRWPGIMITRSVQPATLLSRSKTATIVLSVRLCARECAICIGRGPVHKTYCRHRHCPSLLDTGRPQNWTAPKDHKVSCANLQMTRLWYSLALPLLGSIHLSLIMRKI